VRLQASSWVALAGALSVLAAGCQKQDDHPAYAAGCQSNCAPVIGISLGPGTSGTPGTDAGSDAGTGDLTGQVALLNDEGFVNDVLFNKTASVAADGASGSTVTGNWDGATAYTLENVALEATNWLSVKPDDVQGDALLTYQPVATKSAVTANLYVISSAALDSVFTSVAAPRSVTFGQVVLFFHSMGTGAALSGLHVSMPAAQIAAYASGKAWILDDGTAVTDATGLVVFGNVDSTKANGGTQTVTVDRAATTTSAAISGGTFAVKVVESAATFAHVDVQL
jgi:hypothetical protein